MSWFTGSTVTFCVQLEVFPQASVAVQVMVVVPVGYGAESGWLSLRMPVTVGGGLQLSLAAGALGVAWAAVQPPASATTVTAPEQLMVGGVVSFTVIVWVQLELLPHSSVAV